MKEVFPYRRLKDWPSRFVHFIKDSQDLSDSLLLDWENMNCLQWACMSVEAITGHNPYEQFDPKDGSLKQVVKTIQERGYTSLDAIVEEHFYEVPLAMAQQGDLVLVVADWDAGDSIAQVMPHGVAVCDPPSYWCVLPEGLGKGDLYGGAVVRAFAVGRDI